MRKKPNDASSSAVKQRLACSPRGNVAKERKNYKRYLWKNGREMTMMHLRMDFLLAAVQVVLRLLVLVEKRKKSGRVNTCASSKAHLVCVLNLLQNPSLPLPACCWPLPGWPPWPTTTCWLRPSDTLRSNTEEGLCCWPRSPTEAGGGSIGCCCCCCGPLLTLAPELKLCGSVGRSSSMW